MIPSRFMSATENSPVPESPSVRFRAPDVLLPFLTIILVLTVLYGFVPYSTGFWGSAKSVAAWVYDGWNGKEGDYAHGMLVLPICAGIIYYKRNEIARLFFPGQNWGLPFVVAGLLCFWLGVKADNTYIGYFSAHVLIAGLIIWFYGWPLFKALLFPWAFLVFLWPMPFLDNVIAFPLRLQMSNLAYHTLNLIGVHCLQIGTAVVSMPDYASGLPQGAKFAIDVADPCSGLRSLFALTMVTALYGYFTLPKTWQKWALFIGSPVLAILGNLARILMLTIGTLTFGAPIAIGALDKPSIFHEAAGFLVFFVALGGMVGLAWLLERNWSLSWRRQNP
jgi:exosortase